MKFEDHFIDRVRDSVSIVGLIGGYMSLRESGQNHTALCPFHNEKTPSFLVSESKQIFKCFGCGAGGDSFKFIMLMENLNFPESVHHLAERQGIPLPASGRVTEQPNRERDQFFKIMESACQFFIRQLHKQEESQRYLQGRGIQPATIEEFSIGFSPPGNQLLSWLQKQGFGLNQTMVCGLAKKNQNGQAYDRFRSRIMFPIRDLSGRTIAFGGRTLGDGLPKYLNSPDTPLYHKRNHLFMLDRTRDKIRRRKFAILVEGYFDAIVPYQKGVRNIVASLGTGLTEKQVKLLGRYTRNVVVSYDPDTAGVAASVRSIDRFLEHGFHVNIVCFPGGQDPDTYVRREGVNSYREKLKNSQPYLEFILRRFLEEQADPLSPTGKQKIITQILPYLSRLPNRIERAEYVSRIASRLQLDEELLFLELRRALNRSRKPAQISLTSLVDQTTPAETNLLAALLDPSLSSKVLVLLQPQLFEGLRSEAVFEKILDLREKNQKINVINLRKLLGETDQLDLLERVALRSSEIPLTEEISRNSIQALRKKYHQRLSRQIQEQISKEEHLDAESGRIKELLARKEHLRKKMELDLG